MPCLAVPEIPIPTIPFPFSIALPTLALPTLSVALCCTFTLPLPTLFIPLPPLPPIPPGVDAIIQGVVLALQEVNAVIDLLQLNCPLQ